MQSTHAFFWGWWWGGSLDLFIFSGLGLKCSSGGWKYRYVSNIKIVYIDVYCLSLHVQYSAFDAPPGSNAHLSFSDGSDHPQLACANSWFPLSHVHSDFVSGSPCWSCHVLSPVASVAVPIPAALHTVEPQAPPVLVSWSSCLHSGPRQETVRICLNLRWLQGPPQKTMEY